MRIHLIALLGLFASVAQAQTIKFSAITASGNGQVTPVLVWCTELTASSTLGQCSNPGPAASCTAGGDWTGAKAPSGQETLPIITKSATYNLSCTWASGNQVVLTWTLPPTNTDGSAYSDPKNVRIYSSQTQAGLTSTTPRVLPATATTTTYSGLATGTWYFAGSALNQRDVESAPTNVVSRSVSATTAQAQTVGITVNPVPNTLGNFSAN